MSVYAIHRHNLFQIKKKGPAIAEPDISAIYSICLGCPIPVNIIIPGMLISHGPV